MTTIKNARNLGPWASCIGAGEELSVEFTDGTCHMVTVETIHQDVHVQPRVTISMRMGKHGLVNYPMSLKPDQVKAVLAWYAEEEATSSAASS